MHSNGVSRVCRFSSLSLHNLWHHGRFRFYFMIRLWNWWRCKCYQESDNIVDKGSFKLNGGQPLVAGGWPAVEFWSRPLQRTVYCLFFEFWNHCVCLKDQLLCMAHGHIAFACGGRVVEHFKGFFALSSLKSWAKQLALIITHPPWATAITWGLF